jgi:hypothetical protein
LAALAATLALPALPAQAQPATAGATLAAVRAKRHWIAARIPARLASG